MAPVTVLAYHAIGDCPPEDDPYNLFVSRRAFEWQMSYLARRRSVVSLADAVDGRLARETPTVAITFDDAYVSVLEEARPVLSRYGFPSTVFVPTKWIGRRNEWNPPQPCDVSIMSNEQLLDALRFGIDIQSHGHAHIDMSTANPQRIAEDLASSTQILSQLMGRAPRHLAYPFRSGSPDAHRLVERAGFDAAFSIDIPGDGRFSRERVQITPLDGRALFAVKTSGHYLRLRHNRGLSACYQLLSSVQRELRRAHG